MQNQIKHQEAIFQALPDLFFIIVADGTIIDYKTGIDAYPLPQEIVGQRIQDIMPEEIAPQFSAAIRDLQKTKGIVHFDYPLTIQKHLHFYEARLMPLLESQIVVNIQNITARKTLEQKLIKAKEDAEKANRTTNELLAQTSHELRSPLNGIVRYSQIIQKDKKLTELQHSAIDVIERSCNYLLKLSKDMLELSNIEAKALRQSSINLPKFLTDISEMVRIHAQKKGVSFRYETTSDLPQAIYIDEKSLAQVLVKLLSNAIKFTEHGGVTLKVGYIEQKSQVQFKVSDSGIGIPQNQLEAIFSPFERLDKREGIGLGLSISQKLVRLMGSDLQVESKVGKGSRFWFDLDLVPKQAQALKQQVVIKPNFPSNLQMLYDFAKQGNCSGIDRCLEQMGDKNTPFFHKVNELAQEFQHEEICRLIETK